MTLLDTVIEVLATVPHCQFYGRPVLAGLHFLGNLGIFAAYMLIPLAIEYVCRQRGIPFNRLAACFAAFIFLCGFGHLLLMISLFSPGPTWVWARTVNDLLTALVSMATAAYIFALVPVLLRMPTIAQHDDAVRTLAQYRETEAWRQHGKPIVG